MASALARNPQEALLWALNDLEESYFKQLKFHLRHMAVGQPHIARGELEGLGPVDLASRLTLMYGAQEAVRMVTECLKAMNLLELVGELNHVCLNDYREMYQEHVRCLEKRQEGTANNSYHQLLLVARPSSESSGSAAHPDPKQKLDSVVVEALFRSEENSCPAPSLVVLQGSAGTGKTTLVRKMVLDWATGSLYPGQFDYVFYVSCREMFLLPKCTPEQLLFWCCGDSQAPVTEILKQPERLLFILDGFDELQRPFEDQLKKRQSSPMENMLHLLIRRRLLPTCSLLITTRPPALRHLESMLGERRHVHVLGFSEEERRRYFSMYFTDEEKARNAFDFVQKNHVLYKACQVPCICWMVCSWLKRQMARGQAFSETPSNNTDIFTAYVSTFLPSDDDEGRHEHTKHRVLRGLCTLAAEGIQHQRFLFEEADLRRHNLDGPSLPDFLSINEYQERRDIKKFYSFLNISFQEFFHAMSYLVKEDHSKLRKESRREVERLVGMKELENNEEMTLSMEFLLDILKKENPLNLGLKFSFKVAPSIMQDLVHFTKQMKSMRHKRTWDLEFSLYDIKTKNLAKGIQISDISVMIGQLSERKLHNENSFSVKTTWSTRQDKEQKCCVVGQGDTAGKQKGASSGKDGEREEIDQEVRSKNMVAEKRGQER